MQHISRLITLAVFGVLTAGCYVLLPAGGAAVPAPGTAVALQINDVGRVSLGGSMGPEIERVDGKLVGQEDGAYRVSVTSVKLLRSGEQVWSGENVLIKSEYVSAFFERRFSKGRSLALGAAFAAGVTAFVVKRNLFGTGREHTDTTQRTDTVSVSRGPRQAPPARRFKFHGVF